MSENLFIALDKVSLTFSAVPNALLSSLYISFDFVGSWATASFFMRTTLCFDNRPKLLYGNNMLMIFSFHSLDIYSIALVVQLRLTQTAFETFSLWKL